MPIDEGRDWRIGHHKDRGFTLDIYETSFWGEAAGRLFFLLTDLEWFGKYKNFPFCWINPWNWTRHLGTEDHNVGHWWWKAGQWVCNTVDGWSRSRVVTSISLTDEQVRERFPDVWVDMKFLTEKDEDETA